MENAGDGEGDSDRFAVRLNLKVNRQAERKPSADGRAESIEAALAMVGVPEHYIRYAINRQSSVRAELNEIVRDWAIVSGERVAHAIALYGGYSYLQPQDLIAKIDPGIRPQVLERLPGVQIQAEAGWLPIKFDDRKCTIVATNATHANEAGNALLDFGTPTTIIVSDTTLTQIYERFFIDTLTALREAQDKLISNYQRDTEEGGKVVKPFIAALIRHAANQRASDVYFLAPQSKSGGDQSRKAVGSIKMKVQGAGQILSILPIAIHLRVVTLILNGCGIAKDSLRGGPVDSGFKMLDDDQQYRDITDRYSFRMVSVESGNQTYLVIRLIDRRATEIDLESLGITDKDLGLLRREMNSSGGVILVTGPTGSGKTTTLYAASREIDPIQRHVLSIEKPIEVPNPLYQQLEIQQGAEAEEEENARKLLNAALRSAPDVIIYGEVRRNQEVARIMFDASNTGHKVLSTLHTNSAPKAISRLRELGVDNAMIANELRMVTAQRLLRRLCPHCAEEETGPDNLAEIRNLKEVQALNWTRELQWNPRRARVGGCERCLGTGYLDRIMIYELLVIDAQIADLIEQNASVREIKRVGMTGTTPTTLYAKGMALVAQGVTSVDEVLRLTERDQFERSR